MPCDERYLGKLDEAWRMFHIRILTLLAIGIPCETAPDGSLTVTEQLIRAEILELGGEWEVPSQPRLVAFLGDKFESRHYEMLTHLPTLYWFIVADGLVDDYSLSCLSQVRQLEKLHIRFCDVSTDSFSVLRDNRRLKQLNCEQITLPMGAVTQIATLSQIEELTLEDVQFNEDVTVAFSSMKGLKKLVIVSCGGIDEEDIAAIKTALPDTEIFAAGLVDQ